MLSGDILNKIPILIVNSAWIICCISASTISSEVNTFDGSNYTLNCPGEFVLTRVKKGNWSLVVEARNRVPQRGDGRSTVMTSVAMKSSTSDLVQVLVDTNGSLGVLVGGSDISSRVIKTFHDDGETITFSCAQFNRGGCQRITTPIKTVLGQPVKVGVSLHAGLCVSVINQTLIRVIFSSGVTIEVSLQGSNSVATMVSLPKELHGLTSGLLGTWDGNPANDFTKSDGSSLQGSPSPLDIHNFAKTCRHCSFLSLMVTVDKELLLHKSCHLAHLANEYCAKVRVSHFWW